MVKGVNKNVIEIADTGDECFERAILFVRPDRIDGDGEQIRRRAMRYLSGIRLRPWFYPKGKLLAVLKLLLPAGVGALVTAALFLL